MKTQTNFRLKNLILIVALVGFALPSNAHGFYREIHYKHPHQYVYYPKQNFYYDPMFGQYLVVENGVWVRQPYPPKLLRKININILPHTDIYLTTMYPYYYNAEHRRKYRVMAMLTPSTAFYAFKMPNRYDFSIGAYEYYYTPTVEFAIVDYNPNYYCHPFVARPHKHHGHDPYNYLVVYARNDYYDYHHIPHGRPYYDHHGPQRYAYGPDRHYNHPYNHGYGRPGPPNHGNGHGNYGFGKPNHGPAVPNRPQPGPGPGNKPNGPGNHGGGNMKKTHAEVQQKEVDIRQGNPKQPNGIQKTVNAASTVAVKTLDKPYRNEPRNKATHKKEVVLKHQFDYINRDNNNTIRQR